MHTTLNQLRRAMNRAGRKVTTYARPGGYLHPTKGFRRGSVPPYFRMSPKVRAQTIAAERIAMQGARRAAA